ncbi:acyl-CoA dehydrogenase family protein [Streptomyces sp. SAI-041]|uniref:acyl-CoA dehydrogenase family protein n=1 Tax=Streptomyces sp. SAI-041 TaxID=2940548 RepID=UPI00247354BF|nr:acyl-CoA dehydrogenase family protein [Streptomyces sp. SAI-041]MDH6554469.1 alkylation response protein AidB-like acyl-CoA dehydrogenase [Streptomyces sp. SAI-041]
MSAADQVERLTRRLLERYPPQTTGRTAFLTAQYDAGLTWVHHPAGRGGLGGERDAQRRVFELLTAAGAPNLQVESRLAYSMGAPSVLEWGSGEQQERYLRAIATGERWCQLFSEPGAGSDLAAIDTRAVREQGGWRVTGQKVWTSMAASSQRGMLLARTDPAQPKHRGLTYFVLDLATPGVEIRPLRQITGEAEFSEVYLTDVLIPDTDRLGPINAGWKVAMSTLMNERDMFGTKATESGPVELALALYRERAGGDPDLRTRMVRLWLRGHVLRLYAARAARRSTGTPGPQSSVSKVGFAELNKDGYELCLDLLGDEALLYDTYEPDELTAPSGAGASQDPRRLFLRSRANSIEGGTTEIMRNILAERVLGLPAEPRVDKDLPYSSLRRG